MKKTLFILTALCTAMSLASCSAEKPESEAASQTVSEETAGEPEDMLDFLSSAAQESPDHGTPDINDTVKLFTGGDAEAPSSEVSEDPDYVKPCGNMEMRDKDGNVKMTVDDIYKAEVFMMPGADNIMTYNVALEFTAESTQKFADITSELVGQELAIYVDDELVSSPIINAPIINGQCIISGDFTLETAQELADKIVGVSTSPESSTE